MDWLLISKASCYRWAAYFFGPWQYFIFFLPFVSYFISAPCSACWIVLNLSSALGISDPVRLLSPYYPHWSYIWVHPKWLMKTLTRAKSSRGSCGKLLGSFYCLHLTGGEPWQCFQAPIDNVLLFLVRCNLDGICLALKSWTQFVFSLIYRLLFWKFCICFYVYTHLDLVVLAIPPPPDDYYVLVSFCFSGLY